MINVILVYSDTDGLLGTYFSLCAKDLKQILSNSDYKIQVYEIKGKELNPVSFEITIQNINPKRALFAAYSHGTEDALIHENSAYLGADQNSISFNDIFFYAMACSCGRKLGHKLIEKGCSVFIGYNDDASVVAPFHDIFCECENFGLKRFVEGIRIGDAFKEMKAFFNTKIDEVTSYNAFVASRLRRNRDSLTLLGNSNLHITDINL